ncbi:MAG: hypothetical protein JXD19_07860 [Deltaproteobacteria bacterium]|nr:hypothetical protein [Deltaproteobacteria bacterium]
MKKRAKWVSFGLFLCLVLLVGAQSAFAAFEFADGRVYLTGFFENLTAVRLQDAGMNDRGNLNMFRNTLQMETTLKFNPNFSFFTIIRGNYEGMWDLDNSLDARPEHRHGMPKGDHMKRNLDLREWYFTLLVQDFTIKIGRQQVIWGESDALRMADIINPLDLSWHWVFEDWENIRVPLRMINIKYEPALLAEYQFRAELVWIPEDFRAQVFAPEGGVWSIPGLPQIIWDQERREIPDQHNLKNSEFGARVRAVLGDWEFSIFDFYNRVDNAVYTFDPNHAPLPLRFEWPRVNIVGGTFNYFDQFTKTVFRGEMAYTMDQPHNSIFMDRVIDKDTVAFMLGFDRPTFITWLNPTRTFFISGQWFHKQILDFDRDITTAEMDRSEYWNVVSLLINTQYYHDYITPQVLFVHDFSGNGFIHPSLQYAPSDRWAVTLGAIFIHGQDNSDGLWGPVRTNDEVYLRLRIKF